MELCLRITLLLLLVTGTLTQDGFDLFDALDDLEPTPAKPKEQPKAPEKPNSDAEKPADDSGGYCQRILLEKLNEVLENQKLLLKQRAPSSRFYNGR